MNKIFKLSLFSLLAVALIAGLISIGVAQADGKFGRFGKIVIANRGSGTISVLDAQDGSLMGTYALPYNNGEPTPEPMYVVYVRTGDKVFVGDRANDRVVAFDADSFEVLNTVETGAGVFHMWADPRDRQLWVNNDIDNTTTVINPVTYEVLATVPTPADLVSMGGKPHDVVLDPTGKLAYITVLGISGENDYVVQFRTDTFEEIGRAAAGQDPHLSLTFHNDLLYVPSQGSDTVYIFNRFSMEKVKEIEIPGAHGAGMAYNGEYFYTTNLPGGGVDGIFAIETTNNTIVGEMVDTPYPVPHNIALNLDFSKLFLTHSGPTADKVTFYNVSRFNPVPEYAGEVTVGINPFGLAFVP